MSHLGDKINKSGTSSQVQVHLRLPIWLVDRIAGHAKAVGQTTSVEIRRALVESFGAHGGESELKTKNRDNEGG